MQKRSKFTRKIASVLALSMCLMGPTVQAEEMNFATAQDCATPLDATEDSVEVANDQSTEAVEVTEVTTEANITETSELVPAEASETQDADLQSVDIQEEITEDIEDNEDIDDSEILAGESVKTAIEISTGRTTVPVSSSTKYYVYKPSKDGIINVRSYADSECGLKLQILASDGVKVLKSAQEEYDHNFSGTMAVTAGETYYFCISRRWGSNGNAALEVSLTPYTKNGWLGVDGTWYYLENLTPVKNDWRKVDGYWYYFSDYGEMLKGPACSLYDSATNKRWFYYFGDDGRMKTGWFKQASDWIYCDKSGRAVEGVTTINSVTYLFNYGVMQTDCAYADEQYSYYFGTDGKLVSKVALKNGWLKAGDGWSYILDGKMLTSTMKQIGNYIYYFDATGKMVTNSRQYLYDSEKREYTYFCFNDKGQRVTGWILDHGSWYYYNSDGHAANGKQTINGKTYYFIQGLMKQNYEYIVGESRYYFGQDGTMTDEFVDKDGWTKYRGYWYYREDGALLTRTGKLIEGYFYAFKTDGKMVCNEFYSGYRYDSAGHRVTGWYRDNADRWYYCDKGGFKPSGRMEINGKCYYLSSGKMLTNYYIVAGTTGYYYGSEGELDYTKEFVEGWNSFNDNWYYVENGNLCRNCQKTIKNNTYCFNYYGVMLHNEKDSSSNTFYDTDGHMVTGWYQRETGDYYYFDSNGNPVSGLQTINGKKYYFSDEGLLIVNRRVKVNNQNYIIDEKGNVKENNVKNGWVYEISSKNNNAYYMIDGTYVIGWKKIDGVWYYFDSETQSRVTGMLTIAEKKYSFDSIGRMQTGWIQNEDGLYWADSSGALATDGWRTINNKKYYFDDYKAVTGMKVYSGFLYFFGTDGSLLMKITGDARWISLEGNYYYYMGNAAYAYNGIYKIDGKSYYFHDDGSLKKYSDNVYVDSNGEIVVNSWYEDVWGYWYYIGSGGTPVRGWKQLSGKWYYLGGYGGEMVTGDYIIDNAIYHFDENGVWDGTAKKTGWALADGKYYYLKDGVQLDGPQTINGTTYFLDDGLLIRDCVSSDGTVVNADGKIVKNAWYKVPGYGYVYAGSNGKALTGVQTINGKQYMLTPYMEAQNTVSKSGAILYEIASDGHIVKTVKASKNGWYKAANGDYYYVRNGVYVNGYQIISGVPYYFANYAMQKDVYVDGYGCFGSNGAFVGAQGWQPVNNEWYYLVEGYAMKGAFTEKGKEYYLNASNTKGLVLVDGNYYSYDGNGSRTKINIKNGWNHIGDQWIYSKNGDFPDGIISINGEIYFLKNGIMQTNAFCALWYDVAAYFGADGKIVKNQWITINGEKRYATSSGKIAVGVWKIGGKTYYFGEFINCDYLYY